MKNLTYSEMKDGFISDGLTSIRKLIDGDIKENKVKLPYLSIEEIYAIFEALDIKSNNDFETNGWQYDFWFSGSIKDKILYVSGCAYTGELTITVENQQNKD